MNLALTPCGIVTRLAGRNAYIWSAGSSKGGTGKQDMNAAQLIKECIVMAPFFVGVIAYALLIAAPPGLS